MDSEYWSVELNWIKMSAVENPRVLGMRFLGEETEQQNWIQGL